MARLTKKVFRGLRQLSLLGDAYPKSVPAEDRGDVKAAKAWIAQEHAKRFVAEASTPEGLCTRCGTEPCEEHKTAVNG